LVPANGRMGRVVTGGSTPDTAESELDVPLIDGERQAAACRQGGSGRQSSMYPDANTQSGAGKGSTSGGSPDAAELDAPLIDGVRQAAACRQGSGHDVTYEW